MATDSTDKLAAKKPVWQPKAKIGLGHNNVWRAHVTGATGVADYAFVCKGPISADVVLQHAQQIVNAQSARAVTNGFADPELKVTHVEPIGRSDAQAGAWRPEGAKPIDLNRFVKAAPGTAPGGVERATGDVEPDDKGKGKGK
jgi:hypothetical protein